MISFATTLLSFLVVIAVLIAVHEFGHFWVARKSGIKVLRFSIGFGKSLWQRTGKVDGTEYVVAAVPLGGYVKMLDEGEGPVEEAERHRAFNRQSLVVRSAVVVAGPLANLLFAALVFWVVLVTGDFGIRPVVAEVEPGTPFAEAGFRAGDEILAVGERETPTWEGVVHGLLDSLDEERGVAIRVREEDGMIARRLLSSEGLLGHLEDADPLGKLGITRGPRLPALIGEVVEGEAAAAAGMRAGDLVVAANGDAIAGWSELVAFIRERPGQQVELTIERDGETLPMSAVLGSRSDEDGEVGRIGAAVKVPEGFFERYRVVVREGPIEAVGSAIEKTYGMASLMLDMLWRMLVGEASVEKNLGSVISIAKAAGQSAEYGVAPFLKFLAQISIVLAVMNLLPIPMLDGGHLMFYLIEAIRGKPLSAESQERFNRVGLALLLTLIGVALYLDLIRLLG